MANVQQERLDSRPALGPDPWQRSVCASGGGSRKIPWRATAARRRDKVSVVATTHAVANGSFPACGECLRTLSWSIVIHHDQIKT